MSVFSQIATYVEGLLQQLHYLQFENYYLRHLLTAMASKIQVLENLQIENDHLRHSLSTTTIQLQELRLNSRSQKLRNDDVDSEAETVTL